MFSQDFLSSILKTAMKGGGDFADLFIETSDWTAISFDDGRVKEISSGSAFGAGLRVIHGRSFVYLYASAVDEKRLEELAETMRGAVRTERRGNLGPLRPLESGRLHSIRIPPESVGIDRKVDALRRADSAARGYSPSIAQVNASFFDVRQKILVANMNGDFVEDERVRARIAVTAIATKGDKKQTGFYGPGKSLGFELLERFTPESVAGEAARIACLMLEADYAPTGKLPVVIDNGFGGVIFHEACGHALEATSVADNASVFCGKLGERIANPAVSAVDDGSIPNEWGSAAYDDEANRTRRNLLIENGILKSYLVDRLGSAKMRLPANGCGRRESYKFAPTSRMSNTFILPGPHTLEDLLSGIDEGLYCRNMGGGSVNPPTTDFNFAVQEAYLIKGGKIDKPVKNATLIGKGNEILMNIDMVADKLDYGTGMCGSVSGSIPANVGQPAIRVHGLVVGGRK